MAAQPALEAIQANAAVWPISDQQRREAVNRAKWNVSSVAFFNDQPVSEDKAEDIASAAEKKAFTAAMVASKTTTGDRPAVESVQAYVRKFSQLLLEAIQQGREENEAMTPVPTTSHADVLDLTGEREFLTAESCADLLAPLLMQQAVHNRIKFSTKSFGYDAAEVAAKAIRNVANTLEHADLSDIIAGRPETEALAVLTTITNALTVCKLHGLDISDNALGEKGVRAVANALTSQVALQHLALRNVGCSVKACAALDELLAPLTSLQSLHLYNNMSGDEGAASIARLLSHNRTVQTVQMVSSRVGSQGGIALAQALATGSSLQRLDLHDNPLTAEVAPALGAALTHHPGLRELNLTDTCLTDEGVTVLAEALQAAAPNLQHLELALNEITPEGAKPLALALKGKTSLQSVNLRENELEDRGAGLVLDAVSGHAALQNLDLCANQLKRAAALAAAKFATSTPNLQLLALDENEFPDDAITTLKNCLNACGKAFALGPLDENMPDGDDEDEAEDDRAEDDDGDSAALANQLANQL